MIRRLLWWRRRRPGTVTVAITADTSSARAGFRTARDAADDFDRIIRRINDVCQRKVDP